MIKNANESPGEIHPMALEQLAEYQRIAISWPVYPSGNCNRCGKCQQNIWFEYDPSGRPFIYADYEILALKVAHIRQSHPEAINESH